VSTEIGVNISHGGGSIDSFVKFELAHFLSTAVIN
jgi:hypothetical protein